MSEPRTASQRFIPVAHPWFCGNELEYVRECVETTWVSSIGRFIGQFEKSFAEFCEVDFAVSCNSGTSALHLALLALGVGPGDEVIVPTLTFVATANAVRYCGAHPVFVDSEPVTMNLDPGRIEERITPRTRGIIAVHLYGHAADMDPILEIARRRGLFVVEDAAEAHGALCRGRKAGGLGDAATFSFFGNKIITTGEGGMVTTRDEELGRKVRLLRGQGMDPERRYWFPIVGYNYRMTNIAAALGLAQLEKISSHLEKRRQLAALYERRLAPLAEWIELPAEKAWARHAWWAYTIRLRGSLPLERDRLMGCLAEAGIETRPAFHPMHTLPPYEEPTGSYPVAEAIARHGVTLPMHGLLTEDDVDYISDRLETLCRRPS